MNTRGGGASKTQPAAAFGTGAGKQPFVFEPATRADTPSSLSRRALELYRFERAVPRAEGARGGARVTVKRRYVEALSVATASQSRNATLKCTLGATLRLCVRLARRHRLANRSFWFHICSGTHQLTHQLPGRADTSDPTTPRTPRTPRPEGKRGPRGWAGVGASAQGAATTDQRARSASGARLSPPVGCRRCLTGPHSLWQKK